MASLTSEEIANTKALWDNLRQLHSDITPELFEQFTTLSYTTDYMPRKVRWLCKKHHEQFHENKLDL